MRIDLELGLGLLNYGVFLIEWTAFLKLSMGDTTRLRIPSNEVRRFRLEKMREERLSDVPYLVPTSDLRVRLQTFLIIENYWPVGRQALEASAGDERLIPV
jgi:hypothetical protein